jgi:hypothetical protein
VRTLGKSRGAVLIVVLGVLAILSLLAITFSTLQATEKAVARNYLDTVRAKLIAQSGLQEAEARLRDYFPYRYFGTVGVATPRPWKFWGMDKTETTEPSPKDRLEDSTNPSFALEVAGGKTDPDPTDPNVTPRTIKIDGKEKGISGAPGLGTYATHGDHYALKVSDISGRIYVNDGLDGGANGSVTKNTERILNILGEVLQVPQLGTKLITARPLTGYRNPQDLLKALGYDEAVFARVKDYVSTYAWIDKNVCNPVPLSDGKLAEYPMGKHYYRGTPPIFRAGSSQPCAPDANNSADIATFQLAGGLNTIGTAVQTPKAPESGNVSIYGLDSLNPQWVEIVSRAPVNVNAASREVLVALLTDVRGIFLSDRRRNNPRWEGDLYLSFKQQNTFSPQFTEGDELGYLMETVPIVGPGGTATNGISAFVIADEIIACRNRKASPNYNYSTAPWAGPFKNWMQFYKFIDNLCSPKDPVYQGAGVIDDTRPLHVDYPEKSVDPTGFASTLLPSDIQREHARKAIGDALKANFNPNLHLNELNPDENLYLRVDKTDLVVNSTEFCFAPTGYFEVEALGRIVRPKDSYKDAYLAPDNELVAQAKVTAVYKLYDLYRETTQKHFYAGELPPKVDSLFGTNNDHSLEVGPEPDNGIFPGNFNDTTNPADNEWGGYLAFPTVGGVFGGNHGAPKKAKNTRMATKETPNSAVGTEAFHVHFTLDHDAHFHMINRTEIASEDLGKTTEAIMNYPDLVEGQALSYPGPYNPMKGAPGYPHRLCRSFRQTVNQTTGTVTQPALTAYASSDLRIDGAYAERHSAPAYAIREGANKMWDFDQKNPSGMVSFWFKPGFYPETTGKVRSTFDFSRYHNVCGSDVHVWPFAMWFFPSNFEGNSKGQGEMLGPKYWHNNCGQFQPCSMTWGSKQWHNQEGKWISDPDPNRHHHEFGNLTSCLNHLGHPAGDCRDVKPSPLQGHRWIHVAGAWNVSMTEGEGFQVAKFWINGVTPGTNTQYARFGYTSMTGFNSGSDKMEWWDTHDGGEPNGGIRFGGTSYIGATAVAKDGYRGNFSGDHTVDEIFMWKTEAEGDPLMTWLVGRYYKPEDKTYEGKFVSQAINFRPAGSRTPPPASSVTPGGGTGGTGTGGAGGTLQVLQKPLRILGISYSWYAEDVDWSVQGGIPAVWDWSDGGITAKRPTTLNQRPVIRVGIRDGSTDFMPAVPDDGFTAIVGTDGQPLRISDPTQVRYLVHFGYDDLKASAVLLATPVLDDITLYYDDGESHLLSYTFDSRSF